MPARKTKASPKAKSTAVAKRETNPVANITEERRKQRLAEQMEGLVPTFPVYKMLHAGATQFKMADGEVVKDFSAIIIDRHPANAYWEQPFDQTGGGQFPDCASLDGVTGQGNPGGDCEDCPLNQFGSAPGKKGKGGDGKACKNTERVFFVLEPEDNIPCMMLVPPTSLKVVSMYISQLSSRGIMSTEVFTKFALKEAQNKDGIEYSKLVLTVDPDRDLEEEEVLRLEGMRDTLLNAMRGEQLQRNQFNDEDDAIDVSPETGNGGGNKGTAKRKARRKF